MQLDSMTWLPLMTDSSLTYPTDQEHFDDQMSAPQFLGHWKADLHPMEGQEGVTPYLRQKEFEKAVVALDQQNEKIDTELIFGSCQDAYNWRARLRTISIQATSDLTVPRNPEQKKAAVKLVFKAYKSVALATDNPGMLKAFEEQKHDNRHVETICWSIVEGCIDRCDRGPLLNAYEPEKAKNTASIKTFAERLDAIVESLSRQKTICKHLLDAPYLNRFLDDPVGAKQRVESNRKLNKRKGGVMDVGKKALGMSGRKGRPRGEKTPDVGSDDEGENYGSENQDYPGQLSSISSPFRTPDQPISRGIDHSGPPGLGTSRLHSVDTFRNQSPTPPSRRQRAGTANSLSSFASRNSQSPYLAHYGDPAPLTPDTIIARTQLPPMNVLPSSMLDPALSPYGSNYPYGMHQSGNSMNPYDVNNMYTSRPGSNYQELYTAGPTSAPFQLSDQYPGSPQNQNGMPTFSSGGSGGSNDDSNGSDDEYVPNPSRKRRRLSNH